jgi:hypothetical protein
MTTEDLYVDLISNSNHLYEHDTNTNFNTISKTPPTLDYDKNYLVGLVSINIPNSFDIINSETFYMIIKMRYHAFAFRTVSIMSKESMLEDLNCELRTFRLILKELNPNQYILGTLTGYRSTEEESLTITENEIFENHSDKIKYEINKPFTLIFKQPGALDLRIDYIFFDERRLNLDASSRTSHDVLRDMNKQLSLHLNINLDELFKLTDQNHTRYKIPESPRVEGKPNPRRINSLELSEPLAAICGFGTKRFFDEYGFEKDMMNFFDEGATSEGRFDTKAGFRYCFVYSDIVENSLVGGEQSPLLNIVPIDSDRDITCFQPTHISYKRLTKRNLDTIRLYISTETGSAIKYSTNRTASITARLHIKPQDVPRIEVQ